MSQAIQDFERWLPADLSLAFPRDGVRAEVARALRSRRAMARCPPDERRRIEWLGRWGMAPAAIARLVVGFSTLPACLKRPALRSESKLRHGAASAKSALTDS